MEGSALAQNCDITLMRKALASLGDLPTESERPFLVVVSGLPGTGKSYFSARLAEPLPAVVVETDAVRKALFGSPAYDWRENRRLFPVVHALLRRLLYHRRSVIFDATTLIEANRRPLYRIADETGARLVIVLLEAPEEVVKQRLEARRREPGCRSDADWEVYLRLRARRERITRPHFTVDSSRDVSEDLERLARAAVE